MIKEDKGIFAFARTLGEEKTLVVINTSEEKQDLQVPVKTLNWQEGQTLRSLIDHRPFTVTRGKLPITLPPLSGMYIG
jgi:hypothetical protein